MTFSNHPSRAPVVWLVNGDVTVNGTLNLDGKNGDTLDSLPKEPGPGGFRGAAYAMAPVGVGAGLGPGGSLGANGVYNYGNSKIIPLIGGSGGAGRTAFGEGSGSGAGGAILIAAANTMPV